jgi:hypothetical protein
MPATSGVGGQQDLPAGGQRRLPGHGHLVTQRAGVGRPDTPLEASGTGTLVTREQFRRARVLGRPTRSMDRR